MAPSYHSKATSTQNKWVGFFSFFGSWSVVLHLHGWVKSKFSDIFSLSGLVDVQRLHENDKWILCF